MTYWRNRALSILVLLLGLGLRIADPSVVTEIELRWFDLMQQLKPRQYTPVPVRVVNIDDASLARFGQWPWPRTLLAELIAKLNKLGAAAVALDAVLAEPDRTSPAHALLQIANPPSDVAHWIENLPDHDRVLASAIHSLPVATGFGLTTSGGGRAPAERAGWVAAGDDPAGFVPGYGGAVTTLPLLEQAAAGNGSLNFVPDRDHIVRRVPLLVRYQGKVYPSLVAESLRVAQGAGTYVVKASGANGELSFGAHTGIDRVKIGDFVAETDGSGAVWLYDTGRVAQRTIAAWKILDGSAPATELRGAIVFVGAGATGLGDLDATPLDPSILGTVVDAQIAEQILLHNFVSRPDWAAGAELLYILALGAALILALPRFGAAWSAAGAAAFLTAAFLGSWYSFTSFHLLFDPVYPSIVILSIYLTSSLLNHLQTEGEKRRVRHAFSHYLPAALVEELANDPTKLRLGGEAKNMTFLFTDIRGFTSIAEQCKAHPEAVRDIVTRFTTRMTEVVFRYGGTIDKYMGDCVMAFWNAPMPDPTHAHHACEAALSMRKEIENLNKELAAESSAIRFADGTKLDLTLESGIGINTGDCIVGNLGSEQHFNYSVIGDAVNLASRLEGETKNYGVPVIIGEATEKFNDGLATLELDSVAVKGKREEVRIFALLGDRELNGDPEFRALRIRHDEMLDAFRDGNWRKAKDLAIVCRQHRSDLASLYDFYLNRIEKRELTSLARSTSAAD